MPQAAGGQAGGAAPSAFKVIGVGTYGENPVRVRSDKTDLQLIKQAQRIGGNYRFLGQTGVISKRKRIAELAGAVANKAGYTPGRVFHSRMRKADSIQRTFATLRDSRSQRQRTGMPGGKADLARYAAKAEKARLLGEKARFGTGATVKHSRPGLSSFLGRREQISFVRFKSKKRRG